MSPRSRKPTKSERNLKRKWDDVLKKEGLGVLGDESHWSFPGVNAHGVGFTSLSSVDSDGNAFDATELFEADNERDFGKAITFADTPQAILFRRFAQAVHDTPLNYPHRDFLLAFTESGYAKQAAEKCGLARWTRDRVLRRFCEDFKFSYESLFNGVKPTEDQELCVDADCATKTRHSPHGKGRQMTRAEIKRLRLTPPKRINTPT